MKKTMGPTMLIWAKEPRVVNDRPGYKTSTVYAHYRIVPVYGGFRLHYKAAGASLWAVAREYRKLGDAQHLAENLDNVLEFRGQTLAETQQ
jgi:hypothetical protein